MTERKGEETGPRGAGGRAKAISEKTGQVQLAGRRQDRSEGAGAKSAAPGSRGAGERSAAPGGRTAGTGEKIAGTGEKIGGTGEKIAGTGSRTAGTGERTIGTGERTAGTGERTAGTGEKIAGTGERTAGIGERTAGTGSRTAGIGSRTAGTGSRTAGTGERTAGTGSRTAETGAQAYRDKATVKGRPARERRSRGRRMSFPLILLVLVIGLLAGFGAGWLRWGYEKPYTVDLKAVEVPKWVKQDFIRKNIFSRPDVSLKRVNNIVIHYVANPGKSAMQNRNYFDSLADQDPNAPGQSASAHFIVGLEGEVIQCIPVSEMAYAAAPRNNDTISIETCHPDATGAYTTATYDSLVKLTASLCVQLKLDENDLLRHYDINGKNCPKYFVENGAAWKKFKKDVKAAIKNKSWLEPPAAAGNAGGTIAGDKAGTIAGDKAGTIAGDKAGTIAGDMAGTIAGDMAGTAAGDTAGTTVPGTDGTAPASTAAATEEGASGTTE